MQFPQLTLALRLSEAVFGELRCPLFAMVFELIVNTYVPELGSGIMSGRPGP